MNEPLRVLTAVALCDGHDAAIVAVSRALRRRGFEVVYIGFHKSPSQIARAALQEDVDLIGISSYNGGHAEFVEEVIRHLREAGRDIPVVCGGGGTITPDDARELMALGVARVFEPGMTLEAIAVELEELAQSRRLKRRATPDLMACAAEGHDSAVGQVLTAIEGGAAVPVPKSVAAPFVVGVSGPGGAGKSTLVDELVLRWLAAGKGPVAVLCSDPSISPASHDGFGGALLGDRIRLISTNDPRVFVRSFATRGTQPLSAAVGPVLSWLRHGPYPLVIVETAGIGQADDPFSGDIDLLLLVMTDEFGSPLQLEKMVMLERCDAVVLNKSDRPAALAAQSMLRSRLRSVRSPKGLPVPLFPTIAHRHRDAGVDAVFSRMLEAMASARAKAPAPVGAPAGG